MNTPYRIVVGFDFSEIATGALQEALTTARRAPGAELHLVTVVDKESSDLVPREDRHTSMMQITDNLRERLTAEAGPLVSADPPVTTIAHVRVGSIPDEIANLATEVRADLVVVGTHGRKGVRRLLLGSVAERTLRQAPCPVLVVRPRDYHAMDGLPAIEPPCPECVKAREVSQGARWWCEDHESSVELGTIYARSGRLDQPPSVSPYRS